MNCTASVAEGSSLTLWLFIGLCGSATILLIIGVIGYPPLLQQPGAYGYVIEPLVMLGGYVALIIFVTRGVDVARRYALGMGIVMGMVTGICFVSSLSIETFVDGAALPSLVLTIGSFVLWGVVSFVVARRSGRFGLGVLTAVCSAMLCILITINYGFLLPFVAYGRFTTILARDPDYARSGWHDLHAFILADQYDAAFTHLLEGLIISLIVGCIGSGLARVIRPRLASIHV